MKLTAMNTEQPLKPILKRNNRLLPVLVGVLLVLQLALPHKSWLTLLLGLGGLWLTSYVWARSLAKGLQLNRNMRYGWAQVGDRLEERFVLTNRSWLPALWVEVVDHSTLPDYQAGQVTGVGYHSENHWKTSGVCTRRGIFTLGPTSLRAEDPFGLYTVSLHNPDSVTLTVTPPVVPLPTIEVAPGGRAGEGRSHQHALEQTVSAEGVRAYVPGDSLHAIHWPTTARRSALFVRQFQNTPAGDWWIILDLEDRVQAGQGQSSTEEHGVILTASLADRGLRTGRAVGLMAYGQDLVWLPPAQGDGQRWQILRALAVARLGLHSLADLLTQLPLGRLASLIIITPATDSQWIEALTPLLRRGAVATVLLLDPVAFGGTGKPKAVQLLMADLGIVHHVIGPDLLDRPESRPGHRGQWEWRISPLGRAVAVRRPREMAWRKLGDK